MCQICEVNQPKEDQSNAVAMSYTVHSEWVANARGPGSRRVWFVRGSGKEPQVGLRSHDVVTRREARELAFHLRTKLPSVAIPAH